ncbi:MAG: hypothetical protein EBV03_00070 [Proteobacteria bacterium]|nr:hypothetical protein [Pseudomonadota bacterium]
MQASSINSAATAPDASSALAAWVSAMRVYVHGIRVLKRQLPTAATLVETSARELSEQFRLLASGASEQSEHMKKILDLSGTLELGDQRISLQEFTQLFSNTLGDSIEKILFVSKRAITMVYMLDKAMKELATIQGFITDIQSINKKANLFALNANIEGVRAGEQGRSFRVVAAEVKEVSTYVRTLASNMRAAIMEVSQGVEAGFGVLKDVATTDMSQNLMAQEKLGILLKSLMVQNEEFTRVVAEGARATELISHTVSGMVMNMQFQDRNSQYMDNSVRLLDMMEQSILRLIDASSPFLPAELPPPDEALAELIAKEFRLSEFTQIFRNSLAGKPLDADLQAAEEKAGTGNDDIELF